MLQLGACACNVTQNIVKPAATIQPGLERVTTLIGAFESLMTAIPKSRVPAAAIM